MNNIYYYQTDSDRYYEIYKKKAAEMDLTEWSYMKKIRIIIDSLTEEQQKMIYLIENDINDKEYEVYRLKKLKEKILQGNMEFSKCSGCQCYDTEGPFCTVCLNVHTIYKSMPLDQLRVVEVGMISNLKKAEQNLSNIQYLMHQKKQ